MRKKIITIAIISIFILTGIESLAAVDVKENIKSSEDELPDFTIVEIKNIYFERILWMRLINFDLTIKNNGADFIGLLSWNSFIDGIDPDWYHSPESQGRYEREVSIPSGETLIIGTDQEWPYDKLEHELTVVVDYKFFTELDGYITGEAHGEIEELNETNNYYQINAQYKYKDKTLASTLYSRFLARFPNILQILERLLK